MDDVPTNVRPFRPSTAQNQRRYGRFSSEQIVSCASTMLMVLPLVLCAAIVGLSLWGLGHNLLRNVNTFVFIAALHAIVIVGALIWRLMAKEGLPQKSCKCIGSCSMDAARRW